MDQLSNGKKASHRLQNLRRSQSLIPIVLEPTWTITKKLPISHTVSTSLRIWLKGGADDFLDYFKG